jgi:hypothetical protein
MPINQVRRDTPLAPTSEPRFVQDTIKPKVMTYAEKRAAQQLVRQKNVRAADSIINRSFNATNFNKENPLTKKEYNKAANQAAKTKTIEVDGKNIKKACKRGKSTGSCVSGETYKGQSLKDND